MCNQFRILFLKEKIVPISLEETILQSIRPTLSQRILFNITPRCPRFVESASYDEMMMKWRIEAKNGVSRDMERYASYYLIVASDEKMRLLSEVQGLESLKLRSDSF
ncbi:hypothetical protein TIFTF001_026939 [Ficus carica]|uniref:Uncharacterized protein n=1 Tax=Ficus carica TaxID=3494 RepID=A0AA88IZE4_FICCA|nr:hypothetical protein TIFTF001_026939 [Ficus carica]